MSKIPACAGGDVEGRSVSDDGIITSMFLIPVATLRVHDLHHTGVGGFQVIHARDEFTSKAFGGAERTRWLPNPRAELGQLIDVRS